MFKHRRLLSFFKKNNIYFLSTSYIYEKILIGPPLRKTETAVFRQNMDEKRNKLLRAVSHGDLTTLRELVSKLKNHVDLICFVYAKTGDSAVHIAVENGHLSVLK